jgi:hypothetical protein
MPSLLIVAPRFVPPDSIDCELRQIAIAGYQDAVSTDRAAQGKAVSLFVSDTLNG